METALWTLCVAAITGLTWVAYQHPEGFKKNLFFVLWWFPTSLLGGYALLQFAKMTVVAQFILSAIAEPDNQDSLRREAGDIANYYLDALRSLGIGAAWLAFILFLRYLPSIVGKEEKP